MFDNRSRHSNWKSGMVVLTCVYLPFDFFFNIFFFFLFALHRYSYDTWWSHQMFYLPKSYYLVPNTPNKLIRHCDSDRNKFELLPKHFTSNNMAYLLTILFTFATTAALYVLKCSTSSSSLPKTMKNNNNNQTTNNSLAFISIRVSEMIEQCSIAVDVFFYFFYFVC